MKKITLCIDARMIKNSGIGVYLTELLKLISGRFDLILLGDPGQLAMYEHTARIIPFFTPIYSIKEQYWLPRLVPQCDIFWSPHYNVPVLPIKAAYRVVTIHDVYHLALGHDLSPVKKIYAKFMIKRAVAQSKKVITVSNFSKNEILRYASCKDKKIQVIYNGVVRANQVQPFRTLENKYHLPEKYILFVGNVKPHKNLAVLLKSYLLLDASIINEYQIVVAGKIGGFITGDEATLNFVNDNPVLKEKVIFTGYVDDEDIAGLYHHASLFVFPSLYEGFGLPLLEAMANGCPVIASESSSIPEVCGDAAVYFSPLNEKDLCGKIEAMLNDQSQFDERIKKGFERARLFNWRESADQHINLFNRLLLK
jgi:glycosyltransferase involved in cell wall biosynthesis